MDESLIHKLIFEISVAHFYFVNDAWYKPAIRVILAGLAGYRHSHLYIYLTLVDPLDRVTVSGKVF